MCDKTTKFFHRMRVGENREPHPQFERLKSETREWFYTQMLSKRNEETKRIRRRAKREAAQMENRSHRLPSIIENVKIDENSTRQAADG